MFTINLYAKKMESRTDTYLRVQEIDCTNEIFSTEKCYQEIRTKICKLSESKINCENQPGEVSKFTVK